uniref:Putative secreted protein n=1 Tax=Anopheles marajoara TaxID=58244 RepID=A0A2M4CAF6_9DIPT
MPHARRALVLASSSSCGLSSSGTGSGHRQASSPRVCFRDFAEEVTLLRNVNCATAKYKQPAVRPRTALFGLVWITVRTTGEGAVDLV